jgi:hypothetical protein
MNHHRKLVILDANLVRISRQYGEDLAKWYASPDGVRSASRSRSGGWGAETDPVRLGQSKAGEYSVAVYFNLNTKTSVNRVVSAADDGKDITVGSIAIDVKTTPTWKSWLCWSLAVNDLYWKKKFDVLVGVSINDQDWSQCWIEGWLSKQEFYERKKIADGICDRGKLTAGTWFVEKRNLSDISCLISTLA